MLMMLFFGLTAVWTSVQSYKIAQQEITNQLTEALLLTQADAPTDWLAADTIQQFRGHIRQPELREAAGLVFYTADVDDKAKGLQSRELNISADIRARGYVTYSAWQVWWMSDQRLSILLTLLMFASMAVSLLRVPRRHYGIWENSETMVENVTEVRLTPMQEQLVSLLMSAPKHTMDKQEICQVLWPGKPDASETLYTLVRRTKQALGSQSPLHISSERGRSYRIDVEVRS